MKEIIIQIPFYVRTVIGFSSFSETDKVYIRIKRLAVEYTSNHNQWGILSTPGYLVHYPYYLIFQPGLEHKREITFIA